VVALVPQDAIHGGVVAHDDRVFDVGFGGGQAELDEADARALDAGRAPRRLGGGLVEDEAVDEAGVVDGAAELGD
jgi:hypothetical protein